MAFTRRRPTLNTAILLLGIFPSSATAFVVGTLSTLQRANNQLARRSAYRPTHGTQLLNAGSDIDNVESWPVAQEDRTPSGLDEDEAGNVHIPSNGVSVSDEMQVNDKFVVHINPIDELPHVAQLITESIVTDTFEPHRYLLPLSLERAQQRRAFAIVDIPPFSEQLVNRLRTFMGPTGELSVMLVTSRDAIHYDAAPSVYTLRRADLRLWQQAFPHLEIVAYRLDIPRDCREFVTQVLDGNGPFAMTSDAAGNWTFVETGRPLTTREWDHATAQEVLASGRVPTDKDVDESVEDDGDLYTPDAVRARETGKAVLALPTPGHTFGSISYVFPELGVCVSGCTLPVEDTRSDENYGTPADGPILDCRGYVSTSKAGMSRQMRSAKQLVNAYIDRFHVVLPARGEPCFLDADDVSERRKELMTEIDQYERIGAIYEQLGVTSN